MSEDYIQQMIADRLGGTTFGVKEEMYKFEKIKRLKQEASQSNPQLELIDLGVGEPDEMADCEVVEILAKEAAKKENRFYADNGISEFKEAAAAYMERVFHVNGLDPEQEINHVIGTKSALAMLPAAFINPGEITIMPAPSYPILSTHTKYYGGDIVYLPLSAENSFLPNLSALERNVLEKAKILYLNYPNNPTGALATKEFFEEVVQFAKKNQLIVVHDAAYAALVFEGEKPLSFLSVEGAKEVGVELHSLSKSFNMTGWRIGFIAGNAKLIKAFAAVKDHSDSGQFIAIQKAAAYALSHSEWTERTAEKYSRRHEMLANVLNECGIWAKKPKGSFFLYTKIPTGVAGGPQFPTAEHFSQYLLKEHLISTVPWDEAGSYIRFSVTFQANDQEDEKRVMCEIKKRLIKVQFNYEGERGNVFY